MRNNELTLKYQNALKSFLEKIKQDKYIIAAILAGSLYHDVVWEKSDIDMILIVDDSKRPSHECCLMEDEIIFNVFCYSSLEFRRRFESSLTGSQFHSWLNKTKLLYSKDESILSIYDNISAASENDKDLLLLENGTWSVAGLVKAQRYLYVKKDPLYCAYDLCKETIHKLAAIEVLTNNIIAEKEVILQAIQLNPGFFDLIYTELLQHHKDEQYMANIIRRIEQYLEDKTPALFKIILDFLQEENKICPITEIERKISILSLPKAVLVEPLEWLVQKKYIEKFATSVRLTGKSWVEVDEAAYFYGGE